MQDGDRKKYDVDETYICPAVAAKKFKLAQGLQQTLYIYGVTGHGKTALVKYMLRRKKYVYYSAEETSADQIQVAQDGQKQIVVIDDLQVLAGQVQREEYAGLIGGLLERRDVWLILIARCQIPQWLMTFHMRWRFLVIKEEELKLNRKEQDVYFSKWNLSLTPDKADGIWNMGGGYALFLRFIALSEGDVDRTVSDMWKYIIAYVYDQWDAELQEFLMEMSVVDRFDAQMAQMVTGRSDVRQLITKAMETGNFLTEKDGMYEYNFVLKDSIRTFLGRKFDSGQTGRIYYNAGHMYEMCGDIPNALKMHEAGGDAGSIARLLIANARKNPATGNYFELRKYYLALPEEFINTSPVLMAGMSMLQSMLMNEEESERWYHKLEEFAIKSGGSARREAKSRLLYLDIGLPHRGIVQIPELMKYAGTLLRHGKAVLPEFSVTSNMPSLMNGGKDFCQWSKKDKELASSIGKLVEFVLGKYGKGLVSIALAESFLEKGLDNYEVVSLAEKGRMQAEAGGKTEQVFVAVSILVWLSFIHGNGEDAREILESFQIQAQRDAPWLLPNIAAFRCRIFLYQGKINQVKAWLEDAPDENEEFCCLERFRYLTKIRCFLQFGKYEKAYRLLQKMLYYAEKQKREFVLMESLLLLAVTKYRMGEKGWEETLQDCITRAEGFHFVRIFSREGGAVLKLLRQGDFSWRDEKYRKQVFRECEKIAGYYPSYLKEKMGGEVELSENALKILRLQAEGYRVEQIAKMLDISGNTIKYHSKETYRKLGVSSKAAAVSEAKNRGLI